MMLPDRCFNTGWVDVVLGVLELSWQPMLGPGYCIAFNSASFYSFVIILVLCLLFRYQGHEFGMDCATVLDDANINQVFLQ